MPSHMSCSGGAPARHPHASPSALQASTHGWAPVFHGLATLVLSATPLSIQSRRWRSQLDTALLRMRGAQTEGMAQPVTTARTTCDRALARSCIPMARTYTSSDPCLTSWRESLRVGASRPASASAWVAKISCARLRTLGSRKTRLADVYCGQNTYTHTAIKA